MIFALQKGGYWLDTSTNMTHAMQSLCSILHTRCNCMIYIYSISRCSRTSRVSKRNCELDNQSNHADPISAQTGFLREGFSVHSVFQGTVVILHMRGLV